MAVTGKSGISFGVEIKASEIGEGLITAITTASAQSMMGGSAVGRALFGAATTAAAQNLLETGTVGLQVWKTATTAAAQNALGGGTVGKTLFEAATTAAAQTILGFDAISSPAPGIATIDKAITSLQILSLNATPIELVPAPGANKVLMFEGAFFFYDYNSTAYAGIAAGEDLAIKYNNSSGTTVGATEVTGFLDQTSDQYRFAGPYGLAISNITPQINTPLVLHMVVGEITTGNSPIGVRVQYKTVDISTLSAT